MNKLFYSLRLRKIHVIEILNLFIFICSKLRRMFLIKLIKKIILRIILKRIFFKD